MKINCAIVLKCIHQLTPCIHKLHRQLILDNFSDVASAAVLRYFTIRSQFTAHGLFSFPSSS